MLLPQIRLILDKVENTNSYFFSRATQNDPVEFKDCALTYKLQEGIAEGRLPEDYIASIAVTDSRNNKIQTNSLTAGAIRQFFNRYSGLHPFAASQHMSEAGKFLVTTQDPIQVAITKLWDSAFAERVDTNRWFKLAQIACQSGRRVTSPFLVNGYIDRKHDDEDGIIFVDPAVWPDIIAAYSTDLYKIHPETQLIKINSCESDLTIKALLMRATGSRWENLKRRAGRDDFQFFICGHAIKDNAGYEVGEVYEFTSNRFAYHADSSQHRGHTVNVSKTVLFRSGMNVQDFLDEVRPRSFQLLKGIMQFDEDAIIESLGGLENDEIALESMSALKKRMIEQLVPANHPINVRNVYEQGKAVIRQQIAKINVPGFHGMGAPFESERDRVGIPPNVYDNWIKEHKNDQAYLFRMPYLGAYCGLKVQLVPAWTDTILVNPDDALQLEGDFDGDAYYVIPAHLIQGEDSARKPVRPQKADKAIIELSEENVLKAIIDQATVKNSIGIRDTKLNIAQDQLLFHMYSPEGDPEQIPYWQGVVEQLQIYVQQAVEGLKHASAGSVTDKDADAMLKTAELNPLSKLFTNALLGRNIPLRGTRSNRGYMSHIKAALASGNHSWHPFYPIFAELATYEFGEVLDLKNYHPAIKTQKFRSVYKNRRQEYEALRNIRKTYSQALAAWEGGKNRNIVFGELVLKPIKKQWHALIAPLVDFDTIDGRVEYYIVKDDKYRDQLWDLHRMLADVAYEPTPNWSMTSTYATRDQYGNSRMGLIPRMKKGVVHAKLSPLHKQDDRITKRTWIFDPREADLRWTTWVQVQRGGSFRKVGYMEVLAQKGAIFHHLAQASYVREILSPVLPKNDLKDKHGDSLTMRFDHMRDTLEEFKKHQFNLF